MFATQPIPAPLVLVVPSARVAPATREEYQPPWLGVKFNRETKQLGFFLTQVWDFMEEYGLDLPSNQARVCYVTRALEGEAADWVMTLRDNDAEELHNFSFFMMALRQWFKDPLADWRARTRIRTIKQRRHSIVAYIQEFQGLASWFIDWSQEMLIDYFREGLKRDVFYTCLSQGSLMTLQGWYFLAGEVEIDLASFHEYLGRESHYSRAAKRRDPPKMGKRGPSAR